MFVIAQGLNHRKIKKRYYIFFKVLWFAGSNKMSLIFAANKKAPVLQQGLYTKSVY